MLSRVFNANIIDETLVLPKCPDCLRGGGVDTDVFPKLV